MRKGKQPCVEAPDTDFGACYGSAVNLVDALAERDAASSPPCSNCNCKSKTQSQGETAEYR